MISFYEKGVVDCSRWAPYKFSTSKFPMIVIQVGRRECDGAVENYESNAKYCARLVLFLEASWYKRAITGATDPTVAPTVL